jgi:hypothetical protein
VTSGPISSTPVVRENMIYLANDVGGLYACTHDKKAILWETTLRDQVSADLVVSDAGVFAACRDFSLYLVDLRYGSVIWRVRLAGPLYEPPVLTQDTAYQYCSADGVVAIDLTLVGPFEERTRWKVAGGRAMLTNYSGRTFVLTQHESIAVADSQTGEIETTIPATGFAFGLSWPDEHTVLVASPDGRIFCARPLGIPPLQKDDVIAALRLGGPEAAPASLVRATSQPTSKNEDALRTKRREAPVGGKSKVTREFQPSNESE